MKYVMMLTLAGQRLPILFPEHLVHAHVADDMRRRILRDTKQPAGPVSAGFVSFKEGLSVYGESDTLGLKSRPIDAAYIALGAPVAFMPEDVLAVMWEKLR